MRRSDEGRGGLVARRDALHGALDVDLAGGPIEQRADLLGDQRRRGCARVTE
jgi:hypothetical protein